MPSQVFKSKRHDTGMSPEPMFTPPAGLSWDLEEAGITATFLARLPDAPAAKISGPAQVIGPWTVRYDPTPEDVDTIGAYDVEVEIVRSNGKKITLPTEGFLSWVIGTDLNNS